MKEDSGRSSSVSSTGRVPILGVPQPEQVSPEKLEISHHYLIQPKELGFNFAKDPPAPGFHSDPRVSRPTGFSSAAGPYNFYPVVSVTRL